MRLNAFDELLREVPHLVRLSPQAAWADARRRRYQRRAIAVVMSVVAVAGLGGVGLQTLTGTTEVEPAMPSAGATFLHADRVGGQWQVLRSDGTKLILDPQLDYDGTPLGLSSDGRWISYAVGRPDSGGLLDLYLLRSDKAEPVHATEVGAVQGFGHVWSPDNRVVVVPVADGDFNVVGTDGRILVHQYFPGAIAGFSDDDSLGWVRVDGNLEDQGLTWQLTTLDLATEQSLPLKVDRDLLARTGWAQLMLRQASLSPDHTRVAALLSDHRDRARLLVFALADGGLIDRRDYTEVKGDCPLRWEAERVVVTQREESCVVLPG